MHNMNDYRITTIALLISAAVTVISVILSITVDFFADELSLHDKFTFASLVAIIAILVSLIVFVYEINTKIHSAIINSDMLAKAEDYAVHSKDPGFKKEYTKIKWKLTELAAGHYEIKGQQNVYKDDIESIKVLDPNETLLSVCPVGKLEGSGSEIDELDIVRKSLANVDFLESMEAHYDAARKGLKVKRIYLFKSKLSLDNLDECKDHLNKVRDNGIAVSIIFLDNHPRDDDYVRAVHPRDFILFGNNKVSVALGNMGSRESIAGAEIWSSRDKIESHRASFKELEKKSISYEKYHPSQKL